MMKKSITLLMVLFLLFGLSQAVYAAETETPQMSEESEVSTPSGQSEAAPTSATMQDAQGTKSVVKVPGKTFLPLRVLARPFSNIYKGPDENSGIAEENVPVFQTYYVYTRPDVSITETATEGWYEVGTDNRGTVAGWMKADDVMEWKQTMCLSYQHPGGRKPVLMFQNLEPLRELVKSPGSERIAKTDALFQQIETYRADKSKKVPDDFPVIAVEPKDAVDITKNFYLLPILEYAPLEIEGKEARLLKIASAPKEGRGKPGTVVDNTDGGSGSETEILKKLKMDIVYVVDMTNSMHPFIKSTLDAIKDTVKFVTRDADVEKSVRFGIWGYRDSPDIPNIGFHTKNFTTELQQIAEFEKTLSVIENNQKTFTTDSKNYPEDVFSGVDKAIQETQWTENAIRIIVLMGDAPSHEPGNEWNYSGQSANTLRSLASDRRITILSLHIKDPKRQDYWDVTESQFRTLANNRGVDKPSYSGVIGTDMNAFNQAAQAIAGELVSIVKKAKDGVLDMAGNDKKDPTTTSSGDNDAGNVADKAGKAALVDWIGKMKDVKAPRDITAWVTDKDLPDPSVSSLDVRILINKLELDSLRTTLQDIMTAGRMGMISGDKFFDTLQMVPSVIARAKDQVKNAQTLAETGLLPEFMNDLPYESQVMMISNDIWASWSRDQQEQFLYEVNAKIQLYNGIHDKPEGWVQLNKGDDPDQYVYPISLLEALP
ncbi:MAG: vWA domain-containing protein [Desulfococcaceae bacterium]|jgi:hypothetical protein|nr:vWA domain-containing protein [Desulfococcaceae bacterium]